MDDMELNDTDEKILAQLHNKPRTQAEIFNAIPSINNRTTVKRSLEKLCKHGQVKLIVQKDGTECWIAAEKIAKVEPMPEPAPILPEPIDGTVPTPIQQEYEQSQQPKQHAKPRAKPYTATGIQGFYQHRGNVVIKLAKRVNARSLTLSTEHLDMLTALNQCLNGSKA